MVRNGVILNALKIQGQELLTECMGILEEEKNQGVKFFLSAFLLQDF